MLIWIILIEKNFFDQNIDKNNLVEEFEFSETNYLNLIFSLF